MSSKTFLLFDIDGTLLFSNAVDSLCFATSYEQIFGHPFPSIDWRQYPHVTDHVIFNTVFKQHFERLPEDKERQVFEDHYVAQLESKRQSDPTQFQEVPGAAACWQELANDPRFVLGVATGGWQTPAHIKLRHVGIPIPNHAGYANFMECRDDILQTAIDSANEQHDIKQVIYFGDAIWDVETTHRMGIPLIGVRRKGDTAILRQEGVKVILTDFLDLSHVLSAIQSFQ